MNARRRYLALTYGPAVVWLVMVAPLQWWANGWHAGFGHVCAAATIWVTARRQLDLYRLGYFRGRESLRRIERRARYEPWDWS